MTRVLAARIFGHTVAASASERKCARQRSGANVQWRANRLTLHQHSTRRRHYTILTDTKRNAGPRFLGEMALPGFQRFPIAPHVGCGPRRGNLPNPQILA